MNKDTYYGLIRNAVAMHNVSLHNMQASNYCERQSKLIWD